MHNFELPFPADFLAGSSFKEREREREKQGKKKKAVAESAVKFALSVENFQCSRQGRKFNLRNRVGFQTKFQTFQRVSTFSVFSKAPPPPPLPSPYRNISILYHAYDLQYSSAHVTPADSSNTIFLFFRPFSLRSMRRCTSISHFIRLSQRERDDWTASTRSMCWLSYPFLVDPYLQPVCRGKSCRLGVVVDTIFWG